jgi:hypothetical protein
VDLVGFREAHHARNLLPKDSVAAGTMKLKREVTAVARRMRAIAACDFCTSRL